MPMEQVWLWVPDDVHAKLVSGGATRFGSVVRDHSGIITHLKEVPAPTRAVETAVKKAARVLTSNRVLFFIGLALLVVVAGFFVARAGTKRVRRRRASRAEQAYNAARSAYVEAIRDQRMDDVVVANLAGRLDVLESRALAAGLDLDAPAEPAVAELARLTRDYGRTLASANGVAYLRCIQDEAEPSSLRQAFADIRHQLALQKELWAAA